LRIWHRKKRSKRKPKDQYALRCLYITNDDDDNCKIGQERRFSCYCQCCCAFCRIRRWIIA
jgi:hypothetical protein